MKRKPIHIEADGRALCGAKTEKRLAAPGKATCKTCRKLDAEPTCGPCPCSDCKPVYGGLAGEGLSYNTRVDSARVPHGKGTS